MSWHSVLHMVCGTVAFGSVIAACFVLGRHHSRTGRRRPAVASRVAGAVFLLGYGWAGAGGAHGSVTLLAGVLVGWLWVSATAARYALAGDGAAR